MSGSAYACPCLPSMCICLVASIVRVADERYSSTSTPQPPTDQVVQYRIQDDTASSTGRMLFSMKPVNSSLPGQIVCKKYDSSELHDLFGHDILGHRMTSILYRSNIRSRADLEKFMYLRYADVDLRQIPGLGWRSLQRILDKLHLTYSEVFEVSNVNGLPDCLSCGRKQRPLYSGWMANCFMEDGVEYCFKYWQDVDIPAK